MNNSQKENKEGNLFSVVSLAWELGYVVAVPLIIFALVGRFLDKKLETSPWIFLLGVVISIIVSVFMVYRKADKIIKNQ